MTSPVRYVLPMLIAGGFGALAAPDSEAKPKPLYVFILAGQSNMQGHAHISTMDAMAEDPKTAPLLRELRRPTTIASPMTQPWLLFPGMHYFRVCWLLTARQKCRRIWAGIRLPRSG